MVGSTQSNTTPRNIIIGGTAFLLLGLITPQLTVVGLNFSIFDILNELGLIIYFVAIGLAALAARKTNEQKSALLLSVISFLLAMFVSLAIASLRDDINQLAFDIVVVEVAAFGFGYYAILIGGFATLIGGIYSRSLKSQPPFPVQPVYQTPPPSQPVYPPGQPMNQTPPVNIQNKFCVNCGAPQQIGQFCQACGTKYPEQTG